MLKSRDYRHERLHEEEEHEENENDQAELTINGSSIQEDVETNVRQSTDEQVHTIVLDMAPVSFIDSAGAKTILHVRSNTSSYVNMYTIYCKSFEVEKFHSCRTKL